MRSALRVVPLSLLLALTACGHVRYLGQAATGQLGLLTSGRPIDEVRKDPATPPRIKTLLGELPSLRRFARGHSLTPTTSYQRYVALNDSAVVWVVSACDPLAFHSRIWSFPIVGDFPYLGWFDRSSAEAYADELRALGLDVDVRGASAYSTLGWFPDPLLSSMLEDDDAALGELVNTVLHESVHATLHVPSQAYFNESLASFVAGRMTREYLDWMRGPSSPEARAYAEREAFIARVTSRLGAAYHELETLYASSATNSQKLERKQAMMKALQQELRLRRAPNNAMLVQYRTYDTGVDAFERLFGAADYSWPRFIAALKTLKPESYGAGQQRKLDAVLEPLIVKLASQRVPAAAIAAAPH